MKMIRFNPYHMTSLCIALTTILSSLTFLFSNQYRAFPHFISEADVGQIPSLFFKGGFVVSSIAMAWMIFDSTRRLGKEKKDTPQRFVTTAIGIVTIISLWFVIIYDIHSNIQIHTAAAGICFISSLIWTKVYGSAIGLDSNLFNTGLLLSTLGCMAMIGALILAPGYTSNFETNAYLDSIQHYIVLAAPAEFALVAGLLASIYAFGYEEGEKNSSNEST